MNLDILEIGKDKVGRVDEISSLEGLRPAEIERRGLNKGCSIAREEIRDKLGVHERRSIGHSEA